MAARSEHAVLDFWRRYDEMERRLTTALSERMMDLAGLRPGMRVLDVASGRGEPAIPAARRVAPDGRVIGIDRAGEMLEMARERARREGVRNLELRESSAEELSGIPDGWAQAILLRWGLMYFDAPVRALRRMRDALGPGGLLVVAVWAEPERVTYITLPRRVRSAFMEVPPLDLDVPGPCYYGSLDRLAADLASSGFEILHGEELEVPIVESGEVDDLVEWFLALGEKRHVESLPGEVRQAWREALISELEHRRAGKYTIGGVTRLVVARAQSSSSFSASR